MNDIQLQQQISRTITRQFTVGMFGMKNDSKYFSYYNKESFWQQRIFSPIPFYACVEFHNILLGWYFFRLV